MHIKQITTDNLEESSAQEVFDFMAHHLLKQGEPALTYEHNSEEGGCAYRTPEGLSCVAGATLTDKQAAEADSLNRGTSWNDVVDAGIAPEAHEDLISLLQSEVHDRRIPENWPDQLREVASRFNLSYAIVDQMTGAA